MGVYVKYELEDFWKMYLLHVLLYKWIFPFYLSSPYIKLDLINDIPFHILVCMHNLPICMCVCTWMFVHACTYMYMHVYYYSFMCACMCT